MKKGTRVRILRTNEIGTIEDNILIRKNGIVRTYCKVRLDKNPKQDTWFFSDLLGDIKECAFVIFSDQTDKKIIVGVEIDHEQNCICNLKVAGLPDEPEKHQGLYKYLAATFINVFNKCRPCTTKEQ